jgi:predicted PhzF superfamily epimerase YddE/YHI9
MERLEPERKAVTFHTQSGALHVKRVNGSYVMDFPARPSERVAAPAGFAEALGIVPKEVFVNAFNYLAVLEDPVGLRALTPDMAFVARMDRPGVIVTAPGDEPYDFVSRYFAPAKGIPEDPVTGAAHCMLVPYWAARLGKSEFRAFQASRRGGEVVCRLAQGRVELQGACVFYLEGVVEL